MESGEKSGLGFVFSVRFWFKPVEIKKIHIFVHRSLPVFMDAKKWKLNRACNWKLCKCRAAVETESRAEFCH